MLRNEPNQTTRKSFHSYKGHPCNVGQAHVSSRWPRRKAIEYSRELLRPVEYCRKKMMNKASNVKKYEEEAMPLSTEEKGSNEVLINKLKLKKILCSCSCFWIFLVITLLFYTPLLFSFSSLLHCRESAATARTDNIVSSGEITTASTYEGDLLKLESRWNGLTFSSKPSPKHLKIALFVKKWPAKEKAGGLERHALTLHRVLAQRGHQVHIFTGLPIDPNETISSDRSMHFHFSNYTDPVNRFVNKEEAWSDFQNINRQLNGFDIIHTESVCLPPKYAEGLNNVVASWHGIAYEVIHSDIVLDSIRDPDEPRPAGLDQALKEQVEKVIQEIKFFANYRHHIATSDYVGDVLRTIYMLPLENIHIIVNGVNEGLFHPDPGRGRAFRMIHGVPKEAIVLGMAGRLVRDKGHPLVFKVLHHLFMGNQNKNIFVFIAGDGPWASRYTELGPNVKVLGSLSSGSLGDFYNALDIFVNPTLRAQGLDHTLLEAMMCGKALLATHFSSITRSVVVSEEFGYTFSPTYESLKRVMQNVLEDGKEVLEAKGRACRERAALLFTAQKMGAAYERLFLCIAKGPQDNVDYCKYPLSSDLRK